MVRTNGPVCERSLILFLTRDELYTWRRVSHEPTCVFLLSKHGLGWVLGKHFRRVFFKAKSPVMLRLSQTLSLFAYIKESSTGTLVGMTRFR